MRSSLSLWGHTRMVRFHILSLYLMSGATAEEYSEHEERKALAACLTNVLMAHEAATLRGCDEPAAEAEMRAYTLLLRVREADGPAVQTQLRAASRNPQVRGSAWMKKAIEVRALVKQGLSISLLRVLKHSDVPYLMACLVHRQINVVRTATLEALCVAYPTKVPADFPLCHMQIVLGNDSAADSKRFCQAHDLQVGSIEQLHAGSQKKASDCWQWLEKSPWQASQSCVDEVEAVQLVKGAIQACTKVIAPSREDWIDAKRSDVQFSDIVANGMSTNDSLCNLNISRDEVVPSSCDTDSGEEV